MKELSLEELKVIEFDILKMFDRFCKEHNIRYFLGYGTLLGAIRYKKFIPWDDDVDVLVPRADYERLLALFEDSEKYRLYAFERNRKYRFPFAKLCDMDTRLVEGFYPQNGVELGVNIDIFPLDHWDDDLEEAKAEVERIRKLNAKLGYIKVDRPHTKNPLKYATWSVLIACYRLRGSAYYIRRVTGECVKPHQSESRYAGVKAWPIWGDRGIVPADAFADTVEIEFEGAMFPAPIGYDTYLRCLYGDYMPEPPVEKRKTHHSFLAYRR